MTRSTATATLLAMLALSVAAALAVATLVAPNSAQAAPGKANPSKACSERGDTVFGEPGYEPPPLTHGGCTSYEASGKLTGAGYSAQCKNLVDSYPFTFYGVITVDNHGECVDALRSFHTTPPAE